MGTMASYGLISHVPLKKLLLNDYKFILKLKLWLEFIIQKIARLQIEINK